MNDEQNEKTEQQRLEERFQKVSKTTIRDVLRLAKVEKLDELTETGRRILFELDGAYEHARSLQSRVDQLEDVVVALTEERLKHDCQSYGDDE